VLRSAQRLTVSRPWSQYDPRTRLLQPALTGGQENPLFELERSEFDQRGNENFSNADRQKYGPGGRFSLGMFVLTMLLWFGGVLEGFGRGWDAREIAMHVATVTGARLASFVVMGMIVMMSAVGT
jgi:hypothetical protein